MHLFFPGRFRRVSYFRGPSFNKVQKLCSIAFSVHDCFIEEAKKSVVVGAGSEVRPVLQEGPEVLMSVERTS